MVTVLLCTYNGEKYVRDQIQSILDQDYGDFEILVSDDGSKDGTIDIVRSLMSDNPAKIKLTEQNPTTGSAQKHFLKLITEKMYTCTNEILSSLGRMYGGGGDFTTNIDDAGGEGTAQFASDAIQIYCG